METDINILLENAWHLKKYVFPFYHEYGLASHA